MDYFDNISYSISHLFLMLFIYLFITHRYSKTMTRLICISSGLLLNATDILKLNIFPDSGLCYFFITIIQILITQSTGIIISRKRNSKVLFMGLSASNYTLIGSVAACIIMIKTGNPALALATNFLVHAALLHMLYKGLRDTWLKQYENEYTKGWWELCLIPVFFYCSFCFMAFFPYSIYDNPQNILGVVCMLFTMCVSYVVALRYLESDSTRKGIYLKNVLFESYIKGLENQYYLVEQSEKKLKILRHDMRHYTSMVHLLLKQGEYEEIDRIISHINDVMDENKMVKYCPNLIINTILTEMIERAISFGIDVRPDLHVSEKIPVNDYELTAVIANLFENAIFCVKDFEQPHRYIKAKIHCTAEHLLIQMENKYQEQITFDPATGLPKSLKGGNHGLGMQSVHAFSDKINGAIDCFCKDGMFCIMLFAKF